MPHLPLSIVLATRNRAKFLPTTLATILPQITPADELLISDNHSSDGTPTCLAELTKQLPNVRVISPPCGLEIYPHWNFAISQARFEHIVFINDDELYHRRLLPCAREAFLSSPECHFVVGGIVGVHCYFHGRLCVGINRKQYTSREEYEGWDWLQTQSDHAPGNCIIFRRPRLGFRFLDDNPPCADTIMYYQLARSGNCVVLPICVTTHLIHGSNTLGSDFANSGRRLQAHLTAASDSPNPNFSDSAIEARLPMRQYFLRAQIHAASRGCWRVYSATMERLVNDWPDKKLPRLSLWLASNSAGRLTLRSLGSMLSIMNELRRFYPPSKVLSGKSIAALLEQPAELVRAHLVKAKG